jgi:hypothetical protein
MNGRELHGAIYAGEKVERLPVCGIGGWREAVERWLNEGLRPDRDVNEALGLVADEQMGMPLGLNMYPIFPIEILDKGERYVALVDEYGVTKRMLRADSDRSKGRKGAAGATSSMSQWLDFPVKDLRSWKAIFSLARPERQSTITACRVAETER